MYEEIKKWLKDIERDIRIINAINLKNEMGGEYKSYLENINSIRKNIDELILKLRDNFLDDNEIIRRLNELKGKIQNVNDLVGGEVVPKGEEIHDCLVRILTLRNLILKKLYAPALK